MILFWMSLNFSLDQYKLMCSESVLQWINPFMVILKQWYRFVLFVLIDWIKSRDIIFMINCTCLFFIKAQCFLILCILYTFFILWPTFRFSANKLYKYDIFRSKEIFVFENSKAFPGRICILYWGFVFYVSRILKIHCLSVVWIYFNCNNF